MAQIDQMTSFDEQFEVVDALYQEAESMRPKGSTTTPVIQSRPVIQSKPPRPPAPAPQPISEAAAPLSVIDRIEDLYLEAEAMREPLQNTLADKMTEGDESPSIDAAEQINTKEIEEAEIAAIKADIAEDDFGIPARFGDFGEPSPQTEESLETALVDEILSSEDLQSEEAVAEESPSHESELADTTSFDINDPIPDLPDLPDLPELDIPAPIAAKSEEAPALEEIETSADDEISRQLDDVRQAVENAQDSLSPAMTADESEAESHEDDIHEEDAVTEKAEDSQALETAAADNITTDDSLLKPGPELAQFIGETVRDVLDTELPVMVRGLVNEALSERGGRYGNLAGSQIGLRTKSTKEFF